ncbi:SDR family NAD(P)-dependent oxidoreductase [Thalassotalea fusca]
MTNRCISELYSLNEQNVLITGATGYLGKNMAYALCEAGANVYLNGRNEKKVSQLIDELTSKGFNAFSAVFDIKNFEEIELFFKSVPAEDFTAVINNAYAGKVGNFETSDILNYADSYHIGVMAAQKVTQSALRHLRSAKQVYGDAAVINIASMYGVVSPNQSLYKKPEHVNPPFYGAAKAALIQLTKYMACELGKEGIRVNSISPGPFPAEEVQKGNSEFINMLSEKVPLNRIGRPEEIKGPVIFLASQASLYVNGTNLMVDGGWTAW